MTTTRFLRSEFSLIQLQIWMRDCHVRTVYRVKYTQTEMVVTHSA